MNYDSLQALWELGGYGRYVWPSYGLTALAMWVEPWLAGRRLARALTLARMQIEKDR